MAKRETRYVLRATIRYGVRKSKVKKDLSGNGLVYLSPEAALAAAARISLRPSFTSVEVTRRSETKLARFIEGKGVAL